MLCRRHVRCVRLPQNLLLRDTPDDKFVAAYVAASFHVKPKGELCFTYQLPKTNRKPAITQSRRLSSLGRRDLAAPVTRAHIVSSYVSSVNSVNRG